MQEVSELGVAHTVNQIWNNLSFSMLKEKRVESEIHDIGNKERKFRGLKEGWVNWKIKQTTQKKIPPSDFQRDVEINDSDIDMQT